MTEEQFTRYSYRHSEAMILHQRHPERDVEMMLIGVNFEGELFHLAPLDTGYYEDEDYWVHYKYVDKKRARPKMKVLQCNERIKEKG